MLCRELTLLKHSSEGVAVKPLPCGCWSCELCEPGRLVRLRVTAEAGQPTTFLTLTVNPSRGVSPVDRRRIMAEAWQVLLKRMRRYLGGQKIPFLWVIESTKRGEPHKHVLLRMPFVPQRLISQWWAELTGAPIVHIERVNDQRKAARYIAKYIGKGPAKFGKFRRYSKSADWSLGEVKEEVKQWDSEGWEFAGKDVHYSEYVHSKVSQGYYPQTLEGGITMLWKPGYWSSGLNGLVQVPA